MKMQIFIAVIICWFAGMNFILAGWWKNKNNSFLQFLLASLAMLGYVNEEMLVIKTQMWELQLNVFIYKVDIVFCLPVSELVEQWLVSWYIILYPVSLTRNAPDLFIIFTSMAGKGLNFYGCVVTFMSWDD